jgi:ATP-dependent Zn protease
MALNALLAEMDGFAVIPKRPVFVLAATNFEIEEGHAGMGVIDPALPKI